jgi:hypothetical protein
MVARRAMTTPEGILHFCAAANEGKEAKHTIHLERIMKAFLSTVRIFQHPLESE